MKNETYGRVLQMEDSAGFPVAVKRWNKSDENAGKARWEQEMLGLLQGKGIPKLVRAFEDADCFYVVTEWISGSVLKDYVEEAGGFLSSSEAISIGAQMLAVIERMHKTKGGPYIHTDLSPTNVIIKGREVYLIDLESVRCKGRENNFTDEKTVVMGSRPFTAPEVFSGIISQGADYYSLGALMYYMITGSAWEGDGKALEDDQLGSGILKLLDPNPAARKQGLRIFKGNDCMISGEGELQIRKTASVVSERKKELAPAEKQKSVVLYVDNNLRFAVELAHEASARRDLKVGLFAVRESEIVPAAKALGIRNVEIPRISRYFSEKEEEIFFETSTVADWLTKGFAMQPEGFGKLCLGLVTSTALSSSFEYDTEGALMCRWARKNFDLTIFIGGRSMCYTSIYCDRIIAAVEANLWEIERVQKTIFRFEDEYGLKRTGYVAWDYKEGISLSRDKFAAIVGRDSFLGELYNDGSRYLAENAGHTPYCYAMPDVIKEQYGIILQKIINFKGEELNNESFEV